MQPVRGVEATQRASVLPGELNQPTDFAAPQAFESRWGRTSGGIADLTNSRKIAAGEPGADKYVDQKIDPQYSHFVVNGGNLQVR